MEPSNPCKIPEDAAKHTNRFLIGILQRLAAYDRGPPRKPNLKAVANAAAHPTCQLIGGDMSDIYTDLHLKHVINAAGKMTILGVSRVSPLVLDAQRCGGMHFFDMRDLVDKADQRVAELLDTEDAHIVASASAGIAQAVAGILGKGSEYNLHHIKSDRYASDEIVVPKGHNVDYGVPVEDMLRLGGGRVIEAGYANACAKNQIESVLSERSAAVFFVKSHHCVQKNMLTVEEAAEVAHAHSMPLIVDAAAEEDLRRYYRLGADVVIYSGAKAIEGPTSGLLIGRRPYIDWIRCQQYGIGRAMKIGKESILGLLAALTDYVQNGAEPGDSQKQRLDPFVNALNKMPGLAATIVQDAAGRNIYRARVNFGGADRAQAAVLYLEHGDPAIFTRNYLVKEGIIEFDVRAVEEPELQVIERFLTSFLKEADGNEDGS